MTTTETTAPGTCGEHADRPAVGTCGRCGLALCVECAIPFRGSLRCERCAAIDLGDPPPAAPPRRRRLGLERMALAALVGAAVATIPPWHRSGTLTSAFSAWRPTPDPWSTLAALMVAVATMVCAVALTRRARRVGWTVAWTTSAWLGALAAAVSLVSIPGFFTPTPAPIVTAVAAASAGVLGLLRARRLRS